MGICDYQIDSLKHAHIYPEEEAAAATYKTNDFHRQIIKLKIEKESWQEKYNDAIAEVSITFSECVALFSIFLTHFTQQNAIAQTILSDLLLTERLKIKELNETNSNFQQECISSKKEVISLRKQLNEVGCNPFKMFKRCLIYNML